MLLSPVSGSRELWCLEPNTWESDHLPIPLLPTSSRPSVARPHSLMNRNFYRNDLMNWRNSGNSSTSHLLYVARLNAPCAPLLCHLNVQFPITSTSTYVLYGGRPNESQRIQTVDYWAAYKKVDAAFRRPTHSLYRLQWRQLCESRCLPPFLSVAYGSVSSSYSSPRQQAASFAIPTGVSLSLAVEHLEDEFSSAVQSLLLLWKGHAAGATLRPLLCAD